MSASAETPQPTGPQPTQHALLVIWGHFAHEIGLLDQLAGVPIAEKTVRHAPAAKLLTLFLGLLSGIEFLRDLTRGSTPLYHDPALARAWGVPALAEASGVSRTLAAATPASLTALQTVLETLAAPFLWRALADLYCRSAPLVLDADLTGQPVSDTSRTYPGAAFGYMDGQIRLGYQLAVVCLHTALFGRQWLVGQQHPGDTVSASCLLDLVREIERRLGAHPRRRPELLAGRIAAATARAAYWEERVARYQASAQRCLAHEDRVLTQLEQAEERARTLGRRPAGLGPPGQRAMLALLHQQQVQVARQLGRLRKRWATAVQRAERAQALAARARAPIPLWQARYEQLAAENAVQSRAPRCILRLDAGFSSGENLTTLLELGYEIETKANNAALVQALRQRVTAGTPWTRVGKNAEMIGWTNYQLRSCPYPLMVGLERFQTPQGYKHAVLLRFQSDPEAPCPDLPTWFEQYNARGDIEAGIKQTKTVFHVQHPMSRSPVGMGIQIALTLFAANFLGWAEEWCIAHLAAGAVGSGGVKQRVQVLANSPAQVDDRGEHLAVYFDPASSCRGLVVQMHKALAVQLALPW